ncbi:hypothetical protein VIGAN_02278100 [Vigna angularis var. angularis]|uniref:Uncharacterized protein n=1 Tax=Vigna angularis var. angularis TaxID=157739 RepID=A0A0S3RH86_PHAAN|nr:hypothetical protein VIGAN_02278100 [Vigna angularis var. angularis]
MDKKHNPRLGLKRAIYEDLSTCESSKHKKVSNRGASCHGCVRLMMEVAIEKMFAVWFSLQMHVYGDVRRWCSGMVEIASRVVSTTTTSTPIGFLDLYISLAG